MSSIYKPNTKRYSELFIKNNQKALFNEAKNIGSYTAHLISSVWFNEIHDITDILYSLIDVLKTFNTKEIEKLSKSIYWKKGSIIDLMDKLKENK